MASINNHVNVVTSTTGVSVSKPGFGNLLLLTNDADWVERTRTYADAAEVAEDWAAGTPELLAATAIFSQNPCPPRIKIGRRALKSTLRYAISLVHATAGNRYYGTVKGAGVTETVVEYTALADVVISAVTNGTETFTSVAHGMVTGDGPYRLSNSGGGLPAGVAIDTDYWVIRLTVDTFQLATTKANAIAETELLITSDGTGTHTLQRDTNDVIVAQLVQGLNAVVGKNYTAVHTPGAAETDSIVITATAAGDWFTFECSTVLDFVTAMTHADAGVATDLTAIQSADQDWYAVYGTSNSNLEAKAIAAWVQANKKFYMCDLVESRILTVAVTGATDTADDFKTLGYSRTATFYHDKPSQMAGAAWLGRCLPINPGKDNWKWKELEGVSTPEMSSTHRTNLVNKKCNAVEQVLGADFTFDGTTTDGGFIDTRRNLDFVDAEIGTRCIALFVGNDKVPFTNAGAAQIKAKIRAALKYCASTDYPIFDDARDILVSCPDVSDVSDADRALRKYPNFSWSAYEAGAVNSVDPVRGLVIQ